MSAWLSSGGGIGVLLAFMSQGIMDGHDAAIILPSIFNHGRSTSVYGTLFRCDRHQDQMLYVIMLIPIVLAFAALAVMNIIVNWQRMRPENRGANFILEAVLNLKFSA